MWGISRSSYIVDTASRVNSRYRAPGSVVTVSDYMAARVRHRRWGAKQVVSIRDGFGLTVEDPLFAEGSIDWVVTPRRGSRGVAHGRTIAFRIVIGHGWRRH